VADEAKTEEAGPLVSFDDVKRVIDSRCVSCHAEKPAFGRAERGAEGVKLDTAARIRAQRTPDSPADRALEGDAPEISPA